MKALMIFLDLLINANFTLISQIDNKINCLYFVKFVMLLDSLAHLNFIIQRRFTGCQTMIAPPPQSKLSMTEKK